MSASPFDLTGRVALVTGAYRGLGLAIARGMAQAGATVILNGRKPGALADALRELRAAGLKADVAAFDVTDRDAVVAGAAAVAAKHGTVDILGSGGGDLGEDLLGRGVDGLERRSVDRVDELAVDEEPIGAGDVDDRSRLGGRCVLEGGHRPQSNVKWRIRLSPA